MKYCIDKNTTYIVDVPEDYDLISLRVSKYIFCKDEQDIIKKFMIVRENLNKNEILNFKITIEPIIKKVKNKKR